jgi:hypothetical protein
MVGQGLCFEHRLVDRGLRQRTLQQESHLTDAGPITPSTRLPEQTP